MLWTSRLFGASSALMMIVLFGLALLFAFAGGFCFGVGWTSDLFSDREDL